MKLERRLEQLGAPGSCSRGAQPGRLPGEPGRQGAPPSEAEGSPLEQLRRKMAAITGQSSPATPPRPAADAGAGLSELGFVGGGEGVWRRTELLRASHHVGRMPVSAACDVSQELLALLALDPALAEVDLSSALYLDTETTGLGGAAGTLAFLVGMASFEGGRLELEQLLLPSPGHEAALLDRVAERVERSSAVVTFNGKAFDLPLLASRRVMQRQAPLCSRPHLDLLHVARRLHRKRLGRCSLKHVESEVLGFVREGDIAGADVAPCYAHFLRSGDSSVVAAVVHHNAWDVASMAALVGLYGEPHESLDAQDLVELARTLRRGKAFTQAAGAAERALERGAGPSALRARGEIAKARGDRVRALEDFEALCDAVDDASARLELAKLYEHHARRPLAALALVEEGTGESEEALARRRERLVRKHARWSRTPPRKPRVP